MVKQIPIGHGKVALVDDEDYEGVVRFPWRAAKCIRSGVEYWYARAEIWVDGKRCRISLHRFLMDVLTDRSIEVDHKNGDGLDCQKENMRKATRSENAKNRQKHRRSQQSPFKGVQLRRDGTWLAHITKDGVGIPLGIFDSAWDAAKAYDQAARRLHGEFACLNFPDDADAH